jgi:hypothetical protein
MKKFNLFFSILTLIFCIELSGQIKQDCNGNVSIGNISSVKGKLHYSGDLYGTGHVYFHAYEGDGNSGTAYIQARDKSGSSSIGLQFRTQYNGSIVNALAISSSGNININKDSYFYGKIQLHENQYIFGAHTGEHKLQIGNTGITYNVSLTADNGAYFFTPGGYGGTSSYGVGIGMLPDAENTLKVSAGTNGGYAILAYGDCYTTGLWKTSDERFKKDIKNIDEPLEKLLRIKGRSYYYKNKEELQNVSFNRKQIPKSDNICIAKNGKDTIIIKEPQIYPEFPEGKKFGLIAQEIEPIFPELVKFDSLDGTYAIEYDGFIPILIEALKEQQTQIGTLQTLVYSQKQNIIELKKQIEELQNGKMNNEKLKSANVETGVNENDINPITLYQNTPNPFFASTKIEYYLPDNTRIAKIYIYDMNGTQLKSIELHQKGKSSIIIQGNELTAGIYMYTLIVDGQLIDTKRMVLTD